MSSEPRLPAGEVLPLHGLITPTAQGIASRILAKASGGNVTLFAFDAGQGLTEHTSPFDALVLVLDGTLAVTIAGAAVEGQLIVALGAAERQAEEHDSCRIDAVDHGFDAELLRVRSAFFIDQRVAVKTGGH